MCFEGEKHPLVIQHYWSFCLSFYPLFPLLAGWLEPPAKRSEEGRRNEEAHWKNSSFIINLKLKLTCFPQGWRLQWEHGIGPVSLRHSEKEISVMEKSVNWERRAECSLWSSESFNFSVTQFIFWTPCSLSLLAPTSGHSVVFVSTYLKASECNRKCLGLCIG